MFVFYQVALNPRTTRHSAMLKYKVLLNSLTFYLKHKNCSRLKRKIAFILNWCAKHNSRLSSIYKRDYVGIQITWLIFPWWIYSWRCSHHRQSDSQIHYHSLILPKCTHMIYAWSAVHGPLWYCVYIINSYSTLLNWPFVSLLILFILFIKVFVF